MIDFEKCLVLFAENIQAVSAPVIVYKLVVRRQFFGALLFEILVQDGKFCIRMVPEGLRIGI